MKALSGSYNSVVLLLSFGCYFISIECTQDAQSSSKLYQKLHKAAKYYLHEEIIAKETASWLEASCRAITSPRIVHITTNCVQWYGIRSKNLT